MPRLQGATCDVCPGATEALRVLTCSVLSNQRLPLLSLLPPPCSIWPATWLRYTSSETRGMGASRHTVKMLFWMERTDSRFTLSVGGQVGREHEIGVSALGQPGGLQNTPRVLDGLQSFTPNRVPQSHSTL